jgi:hypothetical protein
VQIKIIHLHVHTIPSLNGRHPSILLLGYLPAAILHENKQMVLRKNLGSEVTSFYATPPP